MNTTNARFGSKRYTTIMVVLPRRKYDSTLCQLQTIRFNKWCLPLKEMPRWFNSLIDFQQRKVVGVLGSHDISNYVREFLAFTAPLFAETEKYSVEWILWSNSCISVSLRRNKIEYNLIYGYVETREDRQKAYTCQGWRGGIE